MDLESTTLLSIPSLKEKEVPSHKDIQVYRYMYKMAAPINEHKHSAFNNFQNESKYNSMLSFLFLIFPLYVPFILIEFFIIDML